MTLKRRPAPKPCPSGYTAKQSSNNFTFYFDTDIICVWFSSVQLSSLDYTLPSCWQDFLLKVIRWLLNKLRIKLKMLHLPQKPDGKGYWDFQTDTNSHFFSPSAAVLQRKKYVKWKPSALVLAAKQTKKIFLLKEEITLKASNGFSIDMSIMIVS